MGFCPNYPPCYMMNNDSAPPIVLGSNFGTIDQTGLKILDKDRKVIVEYELQEDVFDGVRIHKLVPKIDAVKILKSYIGQHIIYQLEMDKDNEEPEIIELKVLVTSS